MFKSIEIKCRTKNKHFENTAYDFYIVKLHTDLFGAWAEKMFIFLRITLFVLSFYNTIKTFYTWTLLIGINCDMYLQ